MPLLTGSQRDRYVRECQECGMEFDRRYDPHYQATIQAAGQSSPVYLCEDCHQEGGIFGIITPGEWKGVNLK